MQRFTSFIHTATARLAVSYLAIIMLMSIGFSVVFYNATVRELGHRGPIPGLFDDRGSDNSTTAVRRQIIEDYLRVRAEEGREALLRRLVVLNVFALASGSALSYYLSRRTLKPIEENMASQAQFVSDASHELRTPLTAMQTMNEVALRHETLPSKEAKEIIRNNIEEVIKLKDLTNGLLRLARADGTELPKSAISLQKIALEAMNRVVSLAQSKNISVEDATADVKVLGDMQSLTQCVAVLLDNAIKYSPEGSTVYLSSEKKGRYGYLRVRDEGSGIRLYDLRKIFDRFYRADQSRNKQIVEGHGIGLSLARKIVEKHSGELTAVSTVGKGSTFTLKVPLA